MPKFLGALLRIQPCNLPVCLGSHILLKRNTLSSSYADMDVTGRSHIVFAEGNMRVFSLCHFWYLAQFGATAVLCCYQNTLASTLHTEIIRVFAHRASVPVQRNWRPLPHYQNSRSGATQLHIVSSQHRKTKAWLGLSHNYRKNLWVSVKMNDSVLPVSCPFCVCGERGAGHNSINDSTAIQKWRLGGNNESSTLAPGLLGSHS